MLAATEREFAMRHGLAALLVVGLAFLLLGCAERRRFVGTWTGEVRKSESGRGIMSALTCLVAGSMLGGNATLTLRPRGSGFLKVGVLREQPITWKAQGDKLIVSGYAQPQPESSNGEATVAPVTQPVVCTLSQDGLTLTLDLGPVIADLTRQDGKSRSAPAPGMVKPE